MNGIESDPVKRGRGLAMGVTVALAGMLLVALPAGAAYATDETPADDAVTTQQVEAPAEKATESEVATEPEEVDAEVLADESQTDLEARAAEARVAEQSPAEEGPAESSLAEVEAPVAEAAAATRTISGTVKFPSGMTLAQKRSLTVYVNAEGATSAGKHYKYGVAEFTYKPGSGTTATWTVTGLKAIKYHIWVDAESSGYSSAPLYIGPHNPATGYDGPIDLTSKSFTTPDIDMNVGSVSVTVSAQMTTKGSYDLNLVNQQTGAVTPVRNSIYSGSTEGNVNHANHDFNGTPGTYKLRAKLLNNGVTLYYDGTPFGTRDVSKAKTFKIGLLQRVQLNAVDLREFIDVPKGYKFADDINWLAKEGITTGVNQSNGSLKFLPKAAVSREAMVAFLYRVEAPKGYKPPAKSPFTDVKPGHKFYTQIMWAYENKVTNGIRTANGLSFAPSARISREAMAAFMFRQYKSDIPTQPGAKKLVDVPKGHKFYNEITWMSSNGITTGVKQPNGSLAFAPKDRTSREATAAFLHRAEVKK